MGWGCLDESFFSALPPCVVCRRRPTTRIHFRACGLGQVSGRVICGDTDAPARFASVQLIPEKPSTAPPFDPSKLGKDADFSKVMSAAMKSVMTVSNLSTLAGIDGSFSLDKIPPGTYYVIAQLPGYQSPLAQISAMERCGRTQPR